jgi:organic radical activating enzyme
MSNQSKKTEYSDYAAEMRDKLNEVSNSFCLAKWLQVSLHLPQGRTQSCYHPPTHQIPVELLKNKPSVLHNTPQKIEERKMMMKGERPEGCSYCWKMEDAPGGGELGHMSDRHYRSSEWWSAPSFDEVVENGAEWDVSPRYVEVNFNQACNFKCMYCSPHLSTTWHEEIKTHGPYQLNNFRHNDLGALKNMDLMPLELSSKENPYVKAFWEWWPDIYYDLRVFRMTGGEPLMDANTFKVLKYVNENPNSHLELSITSNLCPPKQELFNRFVSNVKDLEKIRVYEDPVNINPETNNNWYIQRACKHFMLFVSCDGYGKQAEYMRHGMDFDQLVSNTRKFLSETVHSSVTFINTFNILSIPSLKDFLQMILDLRKEFGGKNAIDRMVEVEPTHGVVHPPFRQVVEPFQRIWFDIPVLRYPNWFTIQNSGQMGIEKIKEIISFMEQNVQDENYHKTFQGFKPYEILKLKRNLALMEEGIGDKELRENKINFYKFIEQHDQRRNTNFLKTFPEYETFYNECESEAEL